MSRRLRSRNPDFIKGINFPLQTYAWSGTQFGSSLEAKSGKRPTDASPMIITSQPPGASAKNDTSWKLTFGASHDCVFTLFNGRFFNDTSLFKIPENLGGIYRDAIGTGDQNIYEKANVGDGVQQIQYVVSKNTAKEGRDAETYGADVDEARGIGMRVPLMAGGWGRTIGMRPTDPQPSEDTNKRRNDEEHKLARETWKYGPIDVRWDTRRGVWAAWNDLIADHNGENLGTLVFDTNPDDVCGFPFLKGKLEDVWKIIIDSVALPIGNESDTTQSGKVATHLAHNWTSEVEPNKWLWAPLSSAFIIHREDQSTGKCGQEIFISSPAIEILTTTYFHLDDTFDGPICFTKEDIEKEDLVGCMKFDGAQWVPTVVFDPCVNVGFELAVLFANDQILADNIIAVCKMLLECLDKSPKGVDPEAAKEAAGASQQAANSAKSAENALDNLPAGSGPGGEYQAGDKLSNEVGSQPLTEAEAKALNDSIPAASEAYQNSAQKQLDAANAANEAATATENAQTQAQDLAVANDALKNAEAAAEAAQAALDKAPNDGSTKEAARKANEALSEAQADQAQAQKDFNDANEAAETAVDKAKAADKEANDAAAEAKEKGDQVREDAGEKLPEDAEDARKAREKAGLSEEEEGATPEEAADDALKEACEKIDGMACKNAEDMIALGNNVGESMQKMAADMASAIDFAIDELINVINETLVPGYNPETGTGGIERPVSVAPPPVCPPSTSGSGKAPPEGVAGGPPAVVDDTKTKSITKPTTAERPKKGGGSKSKPPPPEPEKGPGSVTKPDPTGDDPRDAQPPPPPPTCPIIVIKDPCGGPSVHGPCPGGQGSGNPGGVTGPDAGDPGTPEGANQGGVGADGKPFNPLSGGETGFVPLSAPQQNSIKATKGANTGPLPGST